jgi:signal transduction histidine kinase/transcriptional regulator with GAF, ATPase, and Fis domain
LLVYQFIERIEVKYDILLCVEQQLLWVVGIVSASEDWQGTKTMEESSIIERVARIVSSVRPAKTDYTRLAEELESAIPFDVFGVVILRYDQKSVHVTVCQQQEEKWCAAYRLHPFDGSMLQRLMRTGSPELMMREHPEGLDGLPVTHGDALSGCPQLRSALIAPLFAGGHVLGTLELGSAVAGTYQDQNLQRLISAVVRVLATAIAGAQSGGSVEIQDKQRQALKIVSTSLTSKIELPTILNQIVTGITQSLNVCSIIFMYDRRREEFTIADQAGLDEGVIKTTIPGGLPIRDGCIVSKSIISLQPQVTSDIATDDRFIVCRSMFSALHMHSLYSYPLVTDSIAYGALLICSSDAGGFTPLKMDILSLFANQATIAIRNGMLLKAMYQRSRFHKAIEQLDAQYHQEDADLESMGTLLKQVQQVSQEMFGVNLVSMLRFVSRYLPTQSELDITAMLQTSQEDYMLNGLEISDVVDSKVAAVSGSIVQAERNLFEEATNLIIKNTENALENVAKLGGPGHLIAQLQQSADCVTDAWFIMDSQGMCTYMNPAAEALCNVHLEGVGISYSMRSLDPLQNTRVPRLIEEELEKLWPRIRNAQEVRDYLADFERDCRYRPEMRCVLVTEFATNQQRILSTDNLPSDRHYHLTRYPLFAQQNQLEGNALQIRDVTQKVREENNMSMLLSSVSHDLRTPLTTIKAAASGLLQAGMIWSEEDRHEMLEDIDRETDHLTVLVTALVELSHIQMEALILSKEWCNILEILYNTLDKLERVLVDYHIEICVGEKLPLVSIDPVHIGRVFYNLIENAVRRSPEHATIRVIIDNVDSETTSLRVGVVDQGLPIFEHERERIFQSYSELRAHGSGLGLAICKGIVEAHQGTIYVEAPVGADAELLNKGACFVFTLPHSSLAGETQANKVSMIEERSPWQRREMAGEVRR